MDEAEVVSLLQSLLNLRSNLIELKGLAAVLVLSVDVGGHRIDIESSNPFG